MSIKSTTFDLPLPQATQATIDHCIREQYIPAETGEFQQIESVVDIFELFNPLLKALNESKSIDEEFDEANLDAYAELLGIEGQDAEEWDLLREFEDEISPSLIASSEALSVESQLGQTPKTPDEVSPCLIAGQEAEALALSIEGQAKQTPEVPAVSLKKETLIQTQPIETLNKALRTTEKESTITMLLDSSRATEFSISALCGALRTSIQEGFLSCVEKILNLAIFQTAPIEALELHNTFKLLLIDPTSLHLFLSSGFVEQRADCLSAFYQYALQVGDKEGAKKIRDAHFHTITFEDPKAVLEMIIKNKDEEALSHLAIKHHLDEDRLISCFQNEAVEGNIEFLKAIVFQIQPEKLIPAQKIILIEIFWYVVASKQPLIEDAFIDSHLKGLFSPQDILDRNKSPSKRLEESTRGVKVVGAVSITEIAQRKKIEETKKAIQLFEQYSQQPKEQLKLTLEAINQAELNAMRREFHKQSLLQMEQLLQFIHHLPPGIQEFLHSKLLQKGHPGMLGIKV